MVELALVFPMFAMLLIGIVVLGIGVFYQQQVTNAAREAARYAALHSASARCPTVGQWTPRTPESTYDPCDRRQEGWARMTAAGRQVIFGMNPASVSFTPCWSGYVNPALPMPDRIDQPPPGEYVIVEGELPVVISTAESQWAPCLINGVEPQVSASSLPCAQALPTTDYASAASEGRGPIVANQVTVYACSVWAPPMAGFLLIPEIVTLRGVVTEPIERQQ